jgi:hypothetical protein
MCWRLVAEDFCCASPSYVAEILRPSLPPSVDFKGEEPRPDHGPAAIRSSVRPRWRKSRVTSINGSSAQTATIRPADGEQRRRIDVLNREN